MINEDREQKAIDYVLGEMSASDAASFEQELNQDAELQTFTREMFETLGRLGSAATAMPPPPSLPQRILGQESRKVLQFPRFHGHSRHVWQSGA